jgi:hypothetical protein
MKSKLLLVMFTAMTCLLSQYSSAQTRYMDSVFAGYTVDSVTYSQIYGLKMDIYQPAGDTIKNRPVVVLAHEGTFYTGTREDDPTVVRLCQDLAHKGYVTVSIDYRLVANPVYLLDTLNSAVEVFKAISDARAAVRYLYQDAYTLDSFRIDTNNVFIGGNSAGAVLAMHYAYVDSLPELSINHFFGSAVDTIGGTLQGNSGNPGYSSNIKGVISLAGGLNQVSWLGYCSYPVVMAQGDSDVVVPYICAEPSVFGGSVHVPLSLCGLGSLQQSIGDNTPYSSTLVFPGAGHVPWDANDTDFYMVDTLVTSFLYKEVLNLVSDTCTMVHAGINNIPNAATIKLYPNPASKQLNIESSEIISSITMSDDMGRTVSQTSDIDSRSYEMNTSGLSAGIYFIRIYGTSGISPVVRKVTIE